MGDHTRLNRRVIEEYGVDPNILKRIYEKFLYCKSKHPRTPVRKGDLVNLIRDCPNLYRDLVHYPICTQLVAREPRLDAKPLSWMDVVFDMERHVNPYLTWIDILEVVRWNAERSLGEIPDYAVGPSGY